MEKKHTVGNVTAVLMLLLAVAIDCLQGLLTFTVALAPVSWMLSVMALTGFTIWFAILGVSYLKKGGNKLLLTLASAVTEFIPIVNVIPAVTVMVLGTILLSRAEDLIRQAKTQQTPPKQPSTVRTRLARTPMAPQAGAVGKALGTAAKVVPQARAAMTVAQAAGVLRTPKAANDNQPVAANDNQQARDRRAA